MIHPHKPGKMHQVSDAAAQYQGTSLNDHLFSGPDLLNSLFGVLMRFRQDLIAMSCSIKWWFLKKTNLFCVLSEEEEERVDAYQYARQMFGAKCSPLRVAANSLRQ